MNKYWYKNTVIYSLDVEAYKDSNGDGIGDFPGLISRLSYLSGLGINCIWLQPFYCTPNKDDGYDVADYYSVDTRLGDLGHFAQLVDAAHETGIRILIDLVVNHTSNKHYWFKEARKDRNSKYRNYYIWVDEKPEDDGEHAVLAERQDHSNWEYDDVAGSWYYHTFYPEQPDLNISNPDVQEEILRILHFWLKLGICGFRVDAVPHMFREKGNEKFKGDPHQILKKFREFVESQRKDAVLLAEVDVKPRQYQKYFGEHDKMHMLFNFYINNYIFLALAREEAQPIAKALQKLPEVSINEQMANFLRNHDELNLNQLTEKEREEVFSAFAPEEDMRIFGHGIRRRLATMLNNDRKRIEMAYSLLFTLPGIPVLRYGQEIGMGEDLSKEGRHSVRTLMQWNGTKNGGFSKADEDKLVRNIISEGEFGYKKVNVNDQHRDPHSLLNWMARAINLRKEITEIGLGKCEVVKTGSSKVLAISFRHEKSLAVAVHNFSGEEITVTLKLTDAEDITDVFGNETYDAFDPDTAKVKLSPYGYRWIRRQNIY